MAQTGAASVSHVLEDAIATGRLTEAQVFDEDYKPIAGTNPQKYHTANDSFLDANILQIEDTYLKDADVLFAVAVDTNSYLPTHNTRYTKMLTGDYQTDLVGNRTKRLFNDPVGIAAAQNLQPILRQIYRRDTGEIAWDMSAPIYVKGKHWGGFRVGFSLAKIDAEVATAVWRIMLAALLLIGAIGVTAFLVARYITKPLVPVMTMIQEMGKGHLGMRLRTKRKDEIGILANTMDQFADDLQNTVVGTMKKIAAGDLSTNVNPRDTQDEISPALKATTESLRGLVSEANMLTKAAVEGKLATRGDAAKFQGSYRDIVQGVNDTLDAVIGPLNVAAEYVDRISKGDIPSKITDQYNGDFNGIRNNLNQCIDAVNALVADANLLSKAASAGNLATRADAAKHQGDF
ncbi:MAG: HAMP domain-containing protein, partial [Geobacter sp.]|nr:HAMP domain-containing protein [Geobacter sp.]